MVDIIYATLAMEFLEQQFKNYTVDSRNSFSYAEGINYNNLLKPIINYKIIVSNSSGKSPCKTIYDAEDSFPTGSIRKTGRVFLRPDIINLQALDGVAFNVKYLIIIRNTTVRGRLSICILIPFLIIFFYF